MALTNYERQKRWREKNRARYNLNRRNKRKNLSGGDVIAQHESSSQETGKPDTLHVRSAGTKGDSAPPTQLSKIEELRQLMQTASEAPTEPVAKPVVYRDDYGRQISEAQYNALQKRKAEAKNGGYEIDEFTQI